MKENQFGGRKKNKRKEKGKRKKGKEREKRKEVDEFFLDSPVFRPSELVGPTTKDGLLNEDYEYVPKPRDFTEEIREIEVGLRKASQPISTLQEVGIFLLWLIAFLFGQVFKGTCLGLSFWTEVQDCSMVVWG